MNLILIFWVGGSIALLLLIIGIVVSVRSDQNLVEERLGHLVDQNIQVDEFQKQASAPLTDWLNQI
jgi:hypothetical protein